MFSNVTVHSTKTKGTLKFSHHQIVMNQAFISFISSMHSIAGKGDMALHTKSYVLLQGLWNPH